MTARLSHLNDKGEARMVDVSAKEVTSRTARGRRLRGDGAGDARADPHWQGA